MTGRTGDNKTPMVDKNVPMMNVSTNAVCIVLESSRYFFAPYSCEIKIEEPADNPPNRLTGNLSRLKTESIAASPSLPVNRPTITASTVVYKC